jgi:hypothetical protein
MSTFDQHDTNEVPEKARTDLLASDRRCRLLRALATADGEASVRDLAIQIVSQETGRPVERVDSDAVETLRYEIYDQHIPKLAATGAVEYDSLLDKLRILDTSFSEEAARALDTPPFRE